MTRLAPLGAIFLSVLLSLTACGSAPPKPVPPDVVVSTQTTTVRQLQYVPIGADLTQRLVVAGYAAGQITNRILEARVERLETVIAEANIRFDAIACLDGTEPGTDAAKACTDAADAALARLRGSP
jgi:predicted small lipoprotein YifL